jgi:hypothetical protein
MRCGFRRLTFIQLADELIELRVRKKSCHIEQNTNEVCQK